MTDAETAPLAGLEPPLEPADEHNRHLAELTHPPDWKNPDPARRYHLVVVGGGTAGLVSAAGAAGLGARVALVERQLLGGDCLVTGCVPSKAVIRAARAWHGARHGAPFGAPEAGEAPGDFSAAMARMRRLRAEIGHHDSAERFHNLGVEVFLGEGRFVAGDAVEVDGQRLPFKKAVIATGGRPAVPPIPGLAQAGYRTNETIFNLTELPARVAVIGGGPIGCELAQSFARFGSRVFVLDLAPRILGNDDPDAAEVVHRSMARDGVDFLLEVSIQSVEVRGEAQVLKVEHQGEARELEVDEILVATGRAPNVDDLGLEAAGVEFSRRGVQVDDRLRTSNKNIFACGDVASKTQFTHTADAQARIVLRNALFPFGRQKSSALTVPWCTYTSPELAHTGLSAADAGDQGRPIDTVTIPMDDVDRAILDGETEGFLRLYLEKGKDRILGATLVAENAGDLISELTLAITQGIGLGKLSSVIHPYPTQAEVIKKAADQHLRSKVTPFVKSWLDRYFRWTG